MISPVLRAGGRLLGAFLGALAQQGWESGWASPSLFKPAAPTGARPDRDRPPPNLYDKDVHNGELDDTPPPPKIIPGSFGQDKDEDGYQRGNWRREPFATLIVASAHPGDEDEPPGDGLTPELPVEVLFGDEGVIEAEPCSADEADAPAEAGPEAVGQPGIDEMGAGEEGTIQESADAVGSAEGTAADAGVPGLPETGADTGAAPAAPGVHVTARPVRLMPAPPSTGRYGSWDRDRQPWFTGRWGTGSR